jgi:hypothetical protein
MPYRIDDEPSHNSVHWIEPQVDPPANIIILSTASVTQGHRILCRDLLATASVDNRIVRAFQLAPKEETWIDNLDSRLSNVKIIEAPIDDMASAEFERWLYGDIKQYLNDIHEFTSPILFLDHVRIIENRFGKEDSRRILDTITELIRNKGYIAYYRYPRRTRTNGVPDHLSRIFDCSASPNLELTNWQVDALE